MRAFFKGVMLAGVGAMSLGVAACGSKPEKAAEDRVDAAADSMEATGDAIGGSAEQSPDAAASQMESHAATTDKKPG